MSNEYHESVLDVFQFWFIYPDEFWMAVDKGIFEATPATQEAIDAIHAFGDDGEKGKEVITDKSQC